MPSAHLKPFTSESARIAARKRWDAPPPPPPERAIAQDAEDFLAARLLCVRAQLKLLDAAIQSELTSKEPDGQRVDRLAAASMRLSDQEFALSNRPKPGNRRPGPERGPKSQSGSFWGSNPVQQSPSPPAPAQPEVPTPTPEEPTEGP
jgi:hypothetical protein